ncbi:MAG: beta-propeller domain-containing protein [Bifidobacteriaceae bacterium]|jgi:uncharacterized secreted protein with C-terminal beta-propeller domain|nr:beta-propeller domain-containing protein [Bifidobacteriaceae bacterium]
MNDPIFRAMRNQWDPPPALLSRLEEALAADAVPTSASPPPPPAPPFQPARRRLPRRYAALSAVAACIVVALAVVWVSQPASGPPPYPPASTEASRTGESDRAPSTATPADPATYSEVYQAVQGAWDAAKTKSETRGAPMAEAMSADSVSAEGASPASAAGTGINESVDFSETNVQVEGIDEGDIVKTDGSFLYVASKNEVVILEAAGDRTAEVARIEAKAQESIDPEAPLATDGSVIDLMLSGSTLVVLLQEYTPRTLENLGESSSTSVVFDATMTKALLYDVANPNEPRYLTAIGQSGSYRTSRLLEGIVYLVTAYPLLNGETLVEDDPATFAPLALDDGAVAPVPASSIAIPAAYDSPTYAVAGAIDVAKGESVGRQAVLGGAETVYMSAQNLYLATADYSAYEAWTTDPDGRPREPDAQSTAPDQPQTAIIRIALNGGDLGLAAQSAVPGTLINQFALDEFEGHLRLAVNQIADPGTGESIWSWPNRATLLVLDVDLAPVGSIPELVVDESIQSVRFDGSVGYVVTFRQVDPLFAIDLANPTRPQVMSALKIPGFSTYLHPWANGRLLGFGRNTDDDGGENGLKLTMFDTADPYNVTELTTEAFTGDESIALSDHRAVWVDAERNLIGLPVVSWGPTGTVEQYLVYGWSEATGFKREATLSLDELSAYAGNADVRGVQVGDSLYVCSAAAAEVFSLASFEKVGSAAINEFDEESYWGTYNDIYW